MAKENYKPLNNIAMKKQEIKQKQPHESFKVQLDSKTIIYLRRLSDLETWIKRYPAARIIPG